MISSQAPLLYSSMMLAMSTRSGYSWRRRFISASITSKGRSLMSSKFSHLHRFDVVSNAACWNAGPRCVPARQQGLEAAVGCAHPNTLLPLSLSLA